MSVRARNLIVMIVAAVLAAVLGLVGRGWSDVELYAAAAGLIVVIGLVGLPWIEMAPDGAFRRRPDA